MIFVTVGTIFPFDRLVSAVDWAVAEGLIREEVFAQIGRGGAKPQNIEHVEILDKEVFDGYVRKASGLISHAGMGSISAALNHDKPLLVMPRLRKYRELVSDHQLATAMKFEELGHVLAAYDTSELGEKICDLQSFVPRRREVFVDGVTKRISKYLHELSEKRGKF